MASRIPLIRIKYGWLLAGVTSVALNEKHGNSEKLGSYDELTTVAARYEEWWRPYNDQVLNGLCEILNLEFKQNIIDVYVSPWFTPISDPLVIGPAFKSQGALINIVAHELTHRLLTDNTSVDDTRDLLTDWKALYGEDHERKTLVHIPVHAVLKKLYIDVMERPDFLELDIESVQNNKPYVDAWQYVQSNDYNELIKALSISRYS